MPDEKDWSELGTGLLSKADLGLSGYRKSHAQEPHRVRKEEEEEVARKTS